MQQLFSKKPQTCKLRCQKATNGPGVSMAVPVSSTGRAYLPVQESGWAGISSPAYK
jgi:hypothetical protein